MSRIVPPSLRVGLGIVVVLFIPFYAASLLLDWSPAIAQWWTVFVLVLSTVVSSVLSEREEKARKDRRQPGR